VLQGLHLSRRLDREMTTDGALRYRAA
jgi:hypothetical protein